MKNIDEFNARYFPSSGGIAWPDSHVERVALARTIMGIGIVGSHDYWIAAARDVANPSGKAFGPAFVREAAVRQVLSSLTDAQRDAVDELVKIAVHGALFSALVSLDQFPRADLSITVRDEDAGVGPLDIAPQAEDLHDSFFEWLKLYSSEQSDAP